MNRKYIAFTMIALLVLAAIFTRPEAEAKPLRAEDALRLHVIANSDSEEDQAIKYAIRDNLLLMLSDELEYATTKEEAEALIYTHMDEINDMAGDIIRKGGKNYSSTVSIGKASFPTRMYDGTLYPAGEYDAVKVILGNGGGKNWWCVMFPPLCFVDMGGDDENTDLSEGVQYKSFIVELWDKLTNDGGEEHD